MTANRPHRLGGAARLVPLTLAVALIAAGCSGSTDADDEGPDDASAEEVADADDEAVPDTGGDFYDDVVVSTDWLADNLDNPDVSIIEVSVEDGVYERGHIPGAVNYPWHTAFVDTVSRDVVAAEEFTNLGEEAGINAENTVVLYGDRDNWFAAWGAWIFNLYGHVDVRLLDGGRTAWENEGREFAVAAPSPDAGDFTAADADNELRSFLPEVLEVATGESAQALVDIRSAEEFNGEIFAPEGFDELAVRAGHIPGAVNVPWVQAVDSDGTFKSVDELRELYAEVGVDGTDPIIVYCRIGERASHTWFVLSEILGYDASLYDGSWTEYGNSVGVPVENPADTVWGGA